MGQELRLAYKMESIIPGFRFALSGWGNAPGFVIAGLKKERFMKSLIGVMAAASLFAQVPAPTEFEVASVRPNTANDRIVSINVGPGGRFAARGYTLVLLMQRAYGVMDWNVSGGPGWIRTDRYDVSAKAIVEGNLTETQLRPMLQRLLAERFKLRLRPPEVKESG